MTRNRENNRSRRSKVEVTPFQIMDCALIVRITDQLPALNLREFRERVADCPFDSIYHHFCETVIRPSFDDPEFHNDFARWARRALHDHVLAERLEIINPYEFADLEELRKVVLDILDDRLSEIHFIPWALHNRQFFFHSATTVIFDTSLTIDSPEHLCTAISQMTTGSLYYHFWEARRRTPEHTDDFTEWLRGWDGEGARMIKALSKIDFYYMSLRELQRTLVELSDKICGNGARP
ncbi:MAG: hypothetical protein JSV44_12020 [Candidatus Zixiibacteriota bacterium]|nr:MAG: hypothetical protein JSV44_12020 [candidate division Zixibacteria bacterium]